MRPPSSRERAGLTRPKPPVLWRGAAAGALIGAFLIIGFCVMFSRGMHDPQDNFHWKDLLSSWAEIFLGTALVAGVGFIFELTLTIVWARSSRSPK